MIVITQLVCYTSGFYEINIFLTAPIQPVETITSDFDGNSEYHVHHHQHHHHHQHYCGGREDDCGYIEFEYPDDPDFTIKYYDHNNDGYDPVIGYQQQQLDSYTTPATASEPGDYYDYGWDYETAASSEQQTPQTPSYYYQQQQQQQLERQRRRGGKPVRYLLLFNNTMKLIRWIYKYRKNVFFTSVRKKNRK